MEHFDRVAAQMSLAGLGGLTVGAGIAIYKGRPMLRTAVKVGCSWAMVGTALFGLERVADIAARQMLHNNAQIDRDGQHGWWTDDRLRYATHTFGGFAGGAFVGFLHHRRLRPGIALFTPVMIFLAFAEKKFLESRNRRLQSVISETNVRQ